MCSREDYAHLGAAVEDRRPAIAYTTLTADDYVMADPVEATRAGMAEPPFWAVIHPSGAVNLIHGRPSMLELQRAVEGPLEYDLDGNIEPLPRMVPEVEPGFVALRAGASVLADRPLNQPAAAFLRLPPVMTRGPIILIGGPDQSGDWEPLPADVRMRLVAEVIEA